MATLSRAVAAGFALACRRSAWALKVERPHMPNNQPARVAPVLTVDLDEPPETRWYSVVKYFNSTGLLPDTVKAIKDIRERHLTKNQQRRWNAAVMKTLDSDLILEAKGYLKIALEMTGGTIEADVVDLLHSTALYEQRFPSFCTGLLAAMPNGTVIQGRNMDYPLVVKKEGVKYSWDDVTVDVTFVRGGKPLFTSVHWPGQLGVHTGMRFGEGPSGAGGWSFQQNTRTVDNDQKKNLQLAESRDDWVPFTLLSRRVLESTPDYKTALEKMSNGSLLAPMYFVMAGAGPYEGSVLTMERFREHLRTTPPRHSLAEGGLWHVVQTNDDWDKAVSPLDPRRVIENLKLGRHLQSQVSPKFVLDELRSVPLYLGETAFSTLYVPGTGYHGTVLHGGYVKEVP